MQAFPEEMPVGENLNRDFGNMEGAFKVFSKMGFGGEDLTRLKRFINKTPDNYIYLPNDSHVISMRNGTCLDAFEGSPLITRQGSDIIMDIQNLSIIMDTTSSIQRLNAIGSKITKYAPAMLINFSLLNFSTSTNGDLIYDLIDKCNIPV